MTAIIPTRVTADIEGDFVVFLIGARINRPLKIHRWWPVMRAMPRMLRELSQKPELGLLGYHTWSSGLSGIVVQYWRSVEHLMRYAHDREAEHLPAWRAFNRQLKGNDAVGFWHETFMVSAKNYESIYFNMPRFGLAEAGDMVEIKGRNRTAAARLNQPKLPAPPSDVEAQADTSAAA